MINLRDVRIADAVWWEEPGSNRNAIAVITFIGCKPKPFKLFPGFFSRIKHENPKQRDDWEGKIHFHRISPS